MNDDWMHDNSEVPSADRGADRADRQLMRGKYAFQSEPLAEGGCLLRWFVVVEDEPSAVRAAAPLRALGGRYFSNQGAARRAVERRVAALDAAPSHAKTFPHEGGCMGCLVEDTCNACGGSTAAGRCTNGRCFRCHVAHCTSGGNASPGHGYGPLGRKPRP